MDLRTLALERRLGRQGRADQLIQAGSAALVVDVDSPSPRMLAGLGCSEEQAATGLFDQVIDELDLPAGLPAEEPEIRWELARWWLALIVKGAVHSATARLTHRARAPSAGAGAAPSAADPPWRRAAGARCGG
ncbi:hypothetical protein [Kitasatospora sp. NPDC004289]